MNASMRLRHATAPVQADIIEQINHLLTSHVPGGEVPGDGFDRVNYRLEIVLASYDDDEPDDPGQPVRDLLTDIVHLCRAKGWPIDDLLEKAQDMAQTEDTEWRQIEHEIWLDTLEHEAPC